MWIVRALFRLSIVAVGVCLILIFPYVVNRLGQTYVVPKLGGIFSKLGHEISDVKVLQVKYKFPVGLKLEDFSMTLTPTDPELLPRRFTLTGNELFLNLKISQSLLNLVGLFAIGGEGLIFHPEKNIMSDSNIVEKFDVSGNLTDYVQIVARQFEEDFECGMRKSEGSFIGISDLIECYKTFKNGSADPVSDLHFELMINGEKRFITITKIKSRGIELSQNDLREATSLFREDFDFAQIDFIEQHPFHAMDMLRLKRFAEDQTRLLESELLDRGVSVRTGFFYFLVSKVYGITAADSMIAKYTSNDNKVFDSASKISKNEKKEYMAGAHLGKLAYSNGVPSTEFLTREFVEKYLPVTD